MYVCNLAAIWYNYPVNLLTSLAVAIVSFWYSLNTLSLVLAVVSFTIEFAKEDDIMSGRMNLVSRGLCGANGTIWIPDDLK